MKPALKLLCFIGGFGMFALAYSVLYTGPSYGVSFMSTMLVVFGLFLILLPKIIEVIQKKQ